MNEDECQCSECEDGECGQTLSEDDVNECADCQAGEHVQYR
jgi:hypothetical protein